MKYPNINQTITNGSKLLHFLIIFLTAWGIAKVVWWLISPLGYNIPSNTYTNTQGSDGVALGITNRAPFGVIIVKKEEKSEPSIVSQVKVTGVYAGGAKNSIAFLLINGKNSIAMVGESVLSATLTGVQQDGITLRLNNQNITINVDGSNTSNTANTPVASSGNSAPAPFTPPAQQPDNSNNNGVNQPSTAMAPNNSGGDGDSLADKRRKMIEAFQRQNANADADNNSTNNSSTNNQQPAN